MTVLTVIGARPQFVKASVVSRALAQASIPECIVHTGQHFDANMSDVFFDQLSIPRPDHLLDIHGGSHGAMTGRMLAAIEQVLLEQKPARMLVYGDTNSTLAGALAAAKLHIPVAHVEAGLRSFDRQMPEEINRILTDRLSDILFCPTDSAVANLKAEGVERDGAAVMQVGDVMQDAAMFFAQAATAPDGDLPDDGFILVTCHRAENTDRPARLAGIVSALNRLSSTRPVVLPLHPRTRQAMAAQGLSFDFPTIEPVGYLQMLWLLQRAGLVMTDSGGLQKEAFFFGKPCLTLRDTTEWVELIEAGANRLVAADADAIVTAAADMASVTVRDDGDLYGGGQASARIAEALAAA